MHSSLWQHAQLSLWQHAQLWGLHTALWAASTAELMVGQVAAALEYLTAVHKADASFAGTVQFIIETSAHASLTRRLVVEPGCGASLDNLTCGPSVDALWMHSSVWLHSCVRLLCGCMHSCAWAAYTAASALSGHAAALTLALAADISPLH